MNNKQQLVPDLARVRPFDDRSSTNPAVSIPRNICILTRGNVATAKKTQKKKRGRLEVETFAIIKIKCLTRRWQLVVVIMKRLSLTATLPFPLPSPFFVALSCWE